MLFENETAMKVYDALIRRLEKNPIKLEGIEVIGLLEEGDNEKEEK